MTNSQPSPPPPSLVTLEDGRLEITVGNTKGWVSSFHLADPKINQLNKSWINEQKQLP